MNVKCDTRYHLVVYPGLDCDYTDLAPLFECEGCVIGRLDGRDSIHVLVKWTAIHRVDPELVMYKHIQPDVRVVPTKADFINLANVLTQDPQCYVSNLLVLKMRVRHRRPRQSRVNQVKQIKPVKPKTDPREPPPVIHASNTSNNSNISEEKSEKVDEIADAMIQRVVEHRAYCIEHSVPSQRLVPKNDVSSLALNPSQSHASIDADVKLWEQLNTVDVMNDDWIKTLPLHKQGLATLWKQLHDLRDPVMRAHREAHRRDELERKLRYKIQHELRLPEYIPRPQSRNVNTPVEDEEVKWEQLDAEPGNDGWEYKLPLHRQAEARMWKHFKKLQTSRFTSRPSVPTQEEIDDEKEWELMESQSNNTRWERKLSLPIQIRVQLWRNTRKLQQAPRKTGLQPDANLLLIREPLPLPLPSSKPVQVTSTINPPFEISGISGIDNGLGDELNQAIEQLDITPARKRILRSELVRAHNNPNPDLTETIEYLGATAVLHTPAFQEKFHI